jgi:hypothetical protein
MHVQHIEISILTPINNTDLRVRYLKNEIDEINMKKELLKRETKYYKKQSYNQVYEMFIAAGIDITRKILKIKNEDDANQIIDEYENLRIYFNDCLEKLRKRYNSVIFKQMDSKWFI